VNRSLAWGHFRQVLMLVMAPGIPSAVDWEEFLEDSHHDPGETILVVAAETKLTPKQRAEVQAWQERHGTPSVLVTDSMLARGVATALSWFGVRVTAFARQDIDRALASAGIATADRTEAKFVIEGMVVALEERRKHSLTG